MSGKHTIANVIFDLGAVLIEWNPPGILERFTADRDERDRLERGVFRHADWLDMDRGTLTEIAAVPRFAERTGVAGTRIEELLLATRESMMPIRETEVLLEETKASGRGTFCLSNMSTEVYNFISARHEFFQLFDDVVISAAERVIKPDPEIYRRALERFRLDPAQTLFIDDSAANVAAAREQGIHAIRFERTSACFAVIRETLTQDHVSERDQG